MRQTLRTTLAALLWLIAVAGPALVIAAEGEGKSPPTPTTTADPGIPVDELAALLKPLTKAELLVEADAWQALLQEKAQEIAWAEIAVKRQNREIKKTKEIQEQAEEAKDLLDEVKDKADEARASGDADRIAETQEAAKAVHEKVREVRETVEEAIAESEKTAEVKAKVSAETSDELEETAEAADVARRALDRVQKTVDAVEPEDAASVQSAVGEVRDATRQAEEAAGEVTQKAGDAAKRAKAVEQAGKTAETYKEAEATKKAEKVELLERVNSLRDERTQLIDRLKAVIDELEGKTDKDDADTLAKTKDYRLYMTSVSGITVDVKDTTSAWVAIKGWLTSDEGGLRWLTNIATFLGILLAAWFLSRLISRGVHRGLRMMGKASKLLEDFLVGTARWAVMIVGFLMALASLEISIGPLLAIVGAAGFVVAFALQDSLSNFASGLMILFFRPFDVGDAIDAGGVSGKVTSMNLVSTTIKTFDNKDMLVPNNKIWHDVITNVTGVDTRRVDMQFGIGYDDDIDRAQAILEEIVTGHPKVLKDPQPTIRMNTLGDSSVDFICRPWAKTADYWDVYWDVTKAVKKRFDAEGIGIPFPQRDVHLYLEDAGGKAAVAGVLRGRSGGANPQPLELDEDKDDASEG